MKEFHPDPPRFFLRFFRWFCHPELKNYIEGDLVELYHERLKESSERKANLKFIIDVLLLFRPGIIKPAVLRTSTNHYDMIKNYFKIGMRNIRKNKGFSYINIAGLAVGMSVAILIGLWIWEEISYDKNNPNYSRIARVIQNVTNNGQIQTWTSVPFPLGEELRMNYGENFSQVVMASYTWPHLIGYEEKTYAESGGFFEPGVKEILNLKIIEGTADGIIDPSSILISESLAKTIFGEQNALNKILRLDNSEDVIITGIYEDLPLNSSFGEIRYIASWELFGKMQEFSSRSNQWRSNSYQAYIQLADHREMDEVSLKIKDAKLKKVREDERVHNPQLFLFPMSDWHLYSDFENGKNAGGRIQNVWLFGIIGIFVLMLACINFMNLSTAHSEKRSKEVGVRKVVGSQRGQLISQFMSEALLIAFLAFILSLVLVKLILPYFNLLTENKMTILWTNPIFWTLGFGFVLVTGLLAGSYPAIYLSSLRPLTVLKGTFRPGRLSSVPRKALVVFQFTIAVILMIGTVIVFRQVQFAQNRPMGYNNDGLVMLPVFGPEIHDHFDVVKEELFGIQAITGMAESSGPLTDVWSTNSGFDWKGKDPGLALDFPNTAVSVDFGRTVGWTFEAGRDFSSEFISDSSAIILNKAAADFIGFEDPIGETITWDGNPYTVIGVIRDMIMDSPYTPVRPSVYHLLKDEGYIIVKLNGERSADKSIELIESVFKKISPDQPFIYQFAEVEYAKKFGDEQRIGKLSTYFSALAIFISCLGIFGLSSYVAERRTKEIGIRKVLGASIRNIWQMLSGDFVVLVLVSCLIALPAAWFLMKQWLKGYAFHTEISWWIFAGSGLLALVLTLLTVSFQALKAADMNPVDSLRSE